MITENRPLSMYEKKLLKKKAAFIRDAKKD